MQNLCLSRNFVSKPGWPQTHSTCIGLPSAGNAGVCHHCPALQYLLYEGKGIIETRKSALSIGTQFIALLLTRFICTGHALIQYKTKHRETTDAQRVAVNR